MTQQSPRLVGGVYRIGQVIERGSRFTFSSAYNRNTNDVVGLYVVEMPPGGEAARVKGMLQNLERRRQVMSPYVRRVYDWGIDGGHCYIATDPPRGVTLRHVMEKENVDLRRALELARQLALGAGTFLSYGMSNIDLRPQLVTVNIIEATDYVLLDDFGLRTLLSGMGYSAGPQPEDIGSIDPRYATPEQIQGGTAGPWSDVYSVGLLLFEMVTGRPPFVGRTPAETGMLQATAPVPPMVQYQHDVPSLLQEIVERALAKKTTERFSTVNALAKALESVQVPAPGQHYRLGEVTVLGQDDERGVTDATRAMEPVGQDVALQATVLERPEDPPSGPRSAELMRQEEGAYGYLHFEREGEPTRHFALRAKNVVVGRADRKRNMYPDIDLTPIDPKMIISRQHARIRYEETFFYIEDLKSFNGTWLGELKLAPLKGELLQHGDRLRFGSIELIFKEAGKSDPPSYKGVGE